MAQLKPFRAVRYDLEKAGRIEELVCPPYDIISEEERAACLERNPRNIIRLELPRDGENPYEAAGSTYESWREEGVLRRDMDEGFYLYEQAYEDPFHPGTEKKLMGLLCLTRLEDFENGVVLPHEETLSKAKEDRFQLLCATGCNFSPIICLYHDETRKTGERLRHLKESGRPRYEFDQGGVTHRFWVVNDREAIAEISRDFASRKLYIADGHHRYETALRYQKAQRELCPVAGGRDYVMMLLSEIEDEGLTVFPTHRMLRELPDFDGAALLEKAREEFELQPAGSREETQRILERAYEENRHAFGFFEGTSWTVLTLKDEKAMERVLPEKSKAFRTLDVSILHSLILEGLLGIDKKNMAAQKNLFYTRVAEEARESVERGESVCCFLLNPTRVSEISEVAVNGEKMPQKSTYFYPKPLTGLAMNSVKDEREP